MAGGEGGKKSGLSPDLGGARIYKYAFLFSQVSFVNFFPALEPHPLPWNHYLGPLLNPHPRLHTVKLAQGVRVGVCGRPRNLLGGEPPFARREGWSRERFGVSSDHYLPEPGCAPAGPAGTLSPPTPWGAGGEKF